MKSLCVFMCVVAAACATSFSRLVHEEWRAFKLEHQKRYDSEVEDQYRMRIYSENRRKIAKHNQKFARGLVGYSLQLNEYSDLTHREFVSAMTGYNDTSGQIAVTSELKYEPLPNFTFPAEVDWRQRGVVTEVKNQRKCLSCWAFSATGALEGQHSIKKRRLVSLSEQNLIDCSRQYGNRGCKGGTMKHAYLYIKDNKGVDTETGYPYEAMENLCRYKPRDVGAEDSGYVTVPGQYPDDERVLTHAVAYAGPMSVAMHGSLYTFRHYKSGVYDDKHCTSKLRRNHAVLIVGYGSEGGRDYWLVKNSWGRSWGIDGYVKMARNKNNLCGIASDASYPLVA